MSYKDLKFFKEMLLETKERIIRNVQVTVFGIKEPKLDDIRDEIDLASSEFFQGLDLRLLERERKLFKKIENSLKRVEDGSYGICEECEEEIELKRLEARPVAELCFSCKEEQERQERIQAR